MRQWPDLMGQRFGMLVVIGQAESTPSGQRQWRCQCDCGAVTYKATDALTNPDISMCQDCAAQYAIAKAREKVGYVDGTQLSRITVDSRISDNASGIRGVYLEQKTGRYRARIKFQGKVHNLGSFRNPEEAAKARKEAEEAPFESFLAMHKE